MNAPVNPILYPRSYRDMLASAKVATLLTWHRDGQDLWLYHDDHNADRRTVVRFNARHHLHVEISTLSGFDKKKNMWTAECSPRGSYDLPDRRGEKALRLWLSAEAERRTGVTNPAWLRIP